MRCGDGRHGGSMAAALHSRMHHQNQSNLIAVAATNTGGEISSARPREDGDAWRFAEAIIRDKGPSAYENAQARVQLLEREGNYQVAKLWRDVAEAIKWLQAMQGAGKAKGPAHF